MKALFVTGLWPNAQNTYRGIFVREHALALSKVGNEVQVLSLEVYPASALLKTSFQVETAGTGLAVAHARVFTRFPKIVENSRWLLWWLFASKIKKLIHSFKPDVLVGNFIHPGGVIAYFISKATGLPFYLIEHWSGFEKHLTTHPEAKWSKVALHKAKGIASVSAFLANTIAKYVPKEKLVIIPNVIDEDLFKLKNQSLLEPRETLMLLSVMNLSPPKRPELAAEALNTWACRHPNQNLHWKIVGTGTLKQLIQSKISVPNLTVEFLGALDKVALAHQYQEADFTLHPTNYETFGVVPIESILCGTPVIASQVAALPENILDGLSGILTENTGEAWIKAFDKAFSQNWNAEKVRASAIGKFNPHAVGHCLEAFLNGEH